MTKLMADGWPHFKSTCIIVTAEQESKVPTVERALLRIQDPKVEEAPQDDQVCTLYEVAMHVKCPKAC